MPDAFDHITVHVWRQEYGVGVAGCTCTWVGPRRNFIQLAMADEIAHRHFVETAPPERSAVTTIWTYDRAEKQWSAQFVWACGADGTVSTGVNPKNSPGTAAYLTSARARDCPECRLAELSNRQPPRNHHPTMTRGRRTQ